ncbi:MAG TPA: O-antigen ligase family protein [Bryobacteraceae bacterium]|jgi:O-antigen ligase
MIPALLIGVWAASVALIPSIPVAVALVVPVVLLPAAWWILNRSSNWVAGFLGAALLLPPLPIALGNSGPHPALLFAAAGGWVGLVRLREWRRMIDSTARAMLIFLVVLLASVVCAALYSGPEIAMSSLARIGLFGIAVYIYIYETSGPGAATPVGSARTIRWLLIAAFLVALFACLDFYYQLPAPAGYGPQFVWLGSAVLRRAQGLFYEASTLGNFCAFFLVFIAVIASQSSRTISRLWLALVAVALAIALVFSYSRGSIVCLGCALAALLFLRGWHTRIRLRWLVLVVLAIPITMAAVYALFPAFAQLYLLRLSASLEFFSAEPNRILSGRLDSWLAIVTMISEHPWYLLTGIGYKTLPYTNLGGTGIPIVADNMYLSVLLETGIAGFVAFLWMNARILMASYRSAVQGNQFGIWIFCFWIGELVQMLSGDLFTYWRVLALYFWVLACAAKACVDER